MEISQDGQKIINLACGAELADKLRDASVDRRVFNAALERAQEDIKRITTLFRGVLNVVTQLRLHFSKHCKNLMVSVVLDPDIAAQLRQVFKDIG